MSRAIFWVISNVHTTAAPHAGLCKPREMTKTAQNQNGPRECQKTAHVISPKRPLLGRFG